MRILLLSHYWYPENGVPQRRWQWLTKLLTEKGHEVVVLAPPPHYQARESVGHWLLQGKFRSSLGSRKQNGPVGEVIVRTGYVPGGSSLSGRMVNQASVALGSMYLALKKPGILNEYQPDLVIGTVPALPTAPLTALVAKCYGAPYIIDLRDAWPDLLKQSNRWNTAMMRRSIRERLVLKGPFQLFSLIVRFVIDYVLMGASGVISTSSELQKKLENEKRLFSKTHKRNVVTIRNVFPSKVSMKKSVELASNKGELNVLYAGTIGRAQQLQNAITAVAIARDLGTVVNLRFVGTGATVSALKKLVSDLGLTTVEFIDRVRADELSQHYVWADSALVHLTDWEPLSRAVPSKTYELMSVGIHISGVLTGESAKLVETLEAGDIVKPSDPRGLAELWNRLARNRGELIVSRKSSEWVDNERDCIVPVLLDEILNSALSGNNGKK